MAFIRHLVTVPNLPYEVSDQDKGVHILEYLAPERSTLKAGMPLVRVETWWAVLEIEATIDCWVSKNLYDDSMFRRTLVKVGELLSLAYTDADSLIGVDPPYFVLRTKKILRQKPPKQHKD